MRILQVLLNNSKLLIVFFTYCILIVIFAVIYEEEYKQNALAFAFNSEILKAQKNSLKESTQAEINTLQTQLKAFDQLAEKLKTNEPIKITYSAAQILVNPAITQLPQAEFTTPDFRLIFHEEIALDTGTITIQGSYFAISIDFYDKQGKGMGTQVVPNYMTNQFPTESWQYQYLVSMVTRELQPLVEEDQRRLQSTGCYKFRGLDFR